MKLDATITVFTVSPIADPSRGGRWCSVQVWADQGTVNVRQLCELKSRLLTPEGSDATAEVEELIRAVLVFARGLVKAGRVDSISVAAGSLPIGVMPTIERPPAFVERRGVVPDVPRLPTRTVPLPEEG